MLKALRFRCLDNVVLKFLCFEVSVKQTEVCFAAMIHFKNVLIAESYIRN